MGCVNLLSILVGLLLFKVQKMLRSCLESPHFWENLAWVINEKSEARQFMNRVSSTIFPKVLRESSVASMTVSAAW